MSENNSNKNLHGSSNKRGLLDIIIQLKDMDYIVSYKEKPKYKRPNYKKPEFYPDFLVEFDDGDKWIVFTTTSLRERFDRSQWQAYNIKLLDSDVKQAFCVYPEGTVEKEERLFITRQKIIERGDYYSEINHVVSQNEFWIMVEEKALSHVDEGKKKHLIGNNFEAKIAGILSNGDNLNRLKTNSDVIVGSFFDIYKMIVDCLQIPIESTKKITASCDKSVIGRLPGNKNPKTDVLVKVTFDDESYSYYTISCKNTTAKEVTVHESAADDFIKVLNANDNLADLLTKFQEAGSLDAFGNDNAVKLTAELQPLQDKLFKWILGGYGGLGDPEKQCADYILTEHVAGDNIALHIYSLMDYKAKLDSQRKKGNFGTPFKWTYPSKKRGRKIQLKLMIVD